MANLHISPHFFHNALIPALHQAASMQHRCVCSLPWSMFWSQFFKVEASVPPSFQKPQDLLCSSFFPLPLDQVTLIKAFREAAEMCGLMPNAHPDAWKECVSDSQSQGHHIGIANIVDISKDICGWRQMCALRCDVLMATNSIMHTLAQLLVDTVDCVMTWVPEEWNEPETMMILMILSYDCILWLFIKFFAVSNPALLLGSSSSLIPSPIPNTQWLKIFIHNLCNPCSRAQQAKHSNLITHYVLLTIQPQCTFIKVKI